MFTRLSPFQRTLQVNLSKQQALDPDPKAMQQINFTGNLEKNNGATMFFIIEGAKAVLKFKTVLDFSQGTVNL